VPLSHWMRSCRFWRSAVTFTGRIVVIGNRVIGNWRRIRNNKLGRVEIWSGERASRYLWKCQHYLAFNPKTPSVYSCLSQIDTCIVKLLHQKNNEFVLSKKVVYGLTG
jgi:hypothetical protein